MDFNFDIEHIWMIHPFGMDIWITRTHVNTWIIMGVLIVFAIFARVKLRNIEQVPVKFQNVMEMIVEFFDNFVKNAVGEKLLYIGNWFFAVFLFVLLSNLSGLVLMRPPTADWATTFAFALVTFTLIHTLAMRYKGIKHIKGFFEPIPVFFPLNIISELAVPISLSFRLFGNLLAGMLLITLAYQLLPTILTILFPVILHGYFDFFSGVLQTYVFSVLSLTFIGQAAAD